MSKPMRVVRTRIVYFGIVIWACLLQGCFAGPANVMLGGVVAGVGFHSPNNEIEQIYYLGVFDPQEQVPPTVYRVRVHGQASFISNTRFASGWVPAPLVDSLGTSINIDNGQVSIDQSSSHDLMNLAADKRLMMFGPEGFRKAPKDHRLVIVMGASPEKFFAAMDEVTGMASGAAKSQQNAQIQGFILAALGGTARERNQLDDLDSILKGVKPEDES